MEFFDADFCNTLIIRSEGLEEMNLNEACSVINECLIKGGFEGDLLQVGKLKDLSHDFDLGKIIVRKDF